MLGRLACAVSTLLTIIVCGVSPGRAGDLTLAERVRAQEAIERVYYSHQIGAVQPFEKAFPRDLLEHKVLEYLKQSAALEEFWRTPITAAMLQRELERMSRNTRAPQRLQELFAALDRDPLLIQECLARGTLANRLTRNLFAYDTRLHSAARRDAENLRDALLGGMLKPLQEHAWRSEVELVLEPGDPAAFVGSRPAGDARANPRRIRLAPAQFDEWRYRRLGAVGETRPVTEDRDAFRVHLLLEQSDTRLRVATYRFAKTPWDAWWRTAGPELDTSAIATVVSRGHPLPERVAGSPGPFCADDDTWRPTGSAGAATPRYWHSAIWTGNRMIVWGGTDGSGVYFDTGGRYDPATDSWEPTSTLNAPSSRNRHTAVWTGSFMLVWGGYGGSFLDTGSRYNPAYDSWTPISSADAPVSRDNHTAVWTGERMLVWGGNDFDGAEVYFGDGGRYDPSTDSWTALSTANAPSPRTVHSAVWSGSRMIVWGGYGGSNENSGGQYDPATDSWSSTAATNAPVPRRGHSAVWTGNGMVIWGGTSSEVLGTGGRYDPVLDAWTSTSNSGAPSARTRNSAVWTGTRMIVWGGSGDSGLVDTGGRYDPATDSWSNSSTLLAPSARADHTAVWANSFMLIWGGTADTGSSGTGGLYALGHTSDDDADSLSECDGDCNDGNARIYPEAPEVCDGYDNQCPGDPGYGTIDPGCNDDLDGYCDATRVVVGPSSTCPLGGDDCDDTRAVVYPNAPELNDGLDNQCPGDQGYGVIDEISGPSGFLGPNDKDTYSWLDQVGATAYEILRSSAPDFSRGCLVATTGESPYQTDDPPTGSTHFYLVRPGAPLSGSWGQDSQGVERAPACPDEVAAISFQPQASETPEGFAKDWGQPFQTQIGYGWEQDVTGNTRDRAVLLEPRLDTLIFSRSLRSWRLTIPDGVYVVWISTGDAAYPQGPYRVAIEGLTVVSGQTTAAGSFLVTAVCTNVADGELTLELGGLDGNSMLNSIRVETASCTPGTILEQGLISP